MNDQLRGLVLVTACSLGCAASPAGAVGTPDVPASSESAGSRDYQLGNIGAFSEMVGLGVRQLALGPPLPPPQMDGLVDDAMAIVERNGAQAYRDSEFLVTLLYPEEVTRGKDVLVIYGPAAKSAYDGIKAEKAKLEASGSYDRRAQVEIARRFGALLGYPPSRIDEMLGRTGPVEPAVGGVVWNPSENTRVVDLTHPLSPTIPLFPGGRPYQAKVLGTVEKDGYFIQTFEMGEHTGTHVDAAAHFAAGMATVDAIDPARLVGQGAVLDVTGKVQQDADYAVSSTDIEQWEAQHGRLGPHHVVLIRTGWADRWDEPASYVNQDPSGILHFPGVSVAAAELLRSRGVLAIGIDTLSTDVGPSKGFEQHSTFLAGGGYHIENLANLGQVPTTGATIVVAPLPFVGGSGSPARVFALVPGNTAQ